MSLTYPEPPATVAAEAEYVPAYARKPVRHKKVRSWMILAPIGAVVLIGAGATLLMNPGAPAAPLEEPEIPSVAMTPTPPVLPDAPVMETAPAALPADSVAAPAGAPVARVTPTPTATAPTAPVRATPAAKRRVDASDRARSTAEVVPAAPEPTGPRPYTADPAVSGLNTAQGGVQTPPPAPAISTRPLT